MSELMTMPHAREAEEAVLGAVLIDGEIFRRVPLEAGDFYIVRHQWIWEAFDRLARRNQHIDYLTVTDELNTTGRLKELGGAAYLTGLLSATVSIYGAEDYARIVKDKSRRRRAIQAAQRLVQAAVDDGCTLDAAIAQATTDLVNTAIPESGAVHIKRFVSEFYDELERAYLNPADLWGIETGLIDFDRMVGGLQRGEELVLTGEPGLGKTMLGMQIAFHMGMNKHPGAIYEMEMRGIPIIRRQVSAMSGVRTRAMRTGRVAGDEWGAVTKAIELLSQADVYMSDASSWTTTQMRADLARLKDRGIEWFVVDYMDLFGDTYGDNDNEKSKHISSQVHAICKDLNLAGLVIHSMNKSGVAGSTKGKASLSGSVKVIYDADAIWIMSRPDPNSPIIRLTGEKVREGDTEGEPFIELRKKPGGFPAFESLARRLP
jgi:replicative DNA helicase